MQSWRPNIQCQLCPMTFSDQSAISAHNDTAHVHSNTRAPPPPRPEHPDAKYPCEVCGRKFTTSSHMRKHMITVHGIGDVKTFQCDVCSKTFKEKDKLKRHLSAVHRLGDVTMFLCQLCPKVCMYKSNLKRHIAFVHNIDAKTFKCDICFKVFKQNSNLRRHLTSMHE